MALSRSLIGGLANDYRGQRFAADLLQEQARSKLLQGQADDADLERKAQELFGRSYADLVRGTGSAAPGMIPQSPAPGQPSVPMGPPGGTAAPAGGPPAPAMPPAAQQPMQPPQTPPSGIVPQVPAQPPMGNTAVLAQQMTPPPATSLSWGAVMDKVRQIAPDADGRLIAKVVQSYAPLIKQQQDEAWEKAKFNLQLDDKAEARADRLFYQMQSIQERAAAAQMRSEDQRLSIEQRRQAAEESAELRRQGLAQQQALQTLIEQGRNDRAAAAEQGKNQRQDARLLSRDQLAQRAEAVKRDLAAQKMSPADTLQMRQLLAAHAQASRTYDTALMSGNAREMAAAKQQLDMLDQELDALHSRVKAATTPAPAAGGSPAPAPTVARPAGVPDTAVFSKSANRWFAPDGSAAWEADGKPVAAP